MVRATLTCLFTADVMLRNQKATLLAQTNYLILRRFCLPGFKLLCSMKTKTLKSGIATRFLVKYVLIIGSDSFNDIQV